MISVVFFFFFFPNHSSKDSLPRTGPFVLSKEDLRQLALKMEKPRVPGVKRLLEMSLQCRDRRDERRGEAQPGLDTPLSYCFFLP